MRCVWVARVWLLAAIAVMTLPAVAETPLPQLGPAFEVAAVRPADSNAGRGWMGMRLAPSGRFTVASMSLKSMVGYAYILKAGGGTVVGGPAWAQSEQYDIEAKVDEAQVAGWDKLTESDRTDQVRGMMRQLLAERFHLKLHAEMRETPVYALVQAKGGTKMKEAPAPQAMEGEGDAMEKAMRQMKDHPGQTAPGMILCTGNGCKGVAVPMSHATGQIGVSSHADRIVQDETGLKGFYDFAWTISNDKDAATPMQQIEDQLGLKFESRKVPMTAYVIDSAEKPSEN